MCLYNLILICTTASIRGFGSSRGGLFVSDGFSSVACCKSVCKDVVGFEMIIWHGKVLRQLIPPFLGGCEVLLLRGLDCLVLYVNVARRVKAEQWDDGVEIIVLWGWRWWGSRFLVSAWETRRKPMWARTPGYDRTGYLNHQSFLSERMGGWIISCSILDRGLSSEAFVTWGSVWKEKRVNLRHTFHRFQLCRCSRVASDSSSLQKNETTWKMIAMVQYCSMSMEQEPNTVNYTNIKVSGLLECITTREMKGTYSQRRKGLDLACSWYLASRIYLGAILFWSTQAASALNSLKK